MSKMSHDDKKYIRINLQDFIYPFNKENVTETFFSFIISLLLSFIPIIGNMVSFAIRLSYAVKLYRIKTNIIKSNEESFLESAFDIFKFQLWIYIPFVVFLFIVLIILGKSIVPAILVSLLAFAVIFKSLIVSYLIVDVIFVLLGFGLFVNYSIDRKINFKIGIYIVKKYFLKILLCFLPFILLSVIMLLIVSSIDMNILPQQIQNNIHWFIVFNFVKYYLFLIGITSLATSIPFQKQNLEVECNQQIITKKDVLTLFFIILTFAFLYISKDKLIDIANYNIFAKGKWNVVAKLNQPRIFPQLTLLKDGNILVTGGYNDSGEVLKSAEIYDVKKNQFIYIGEMNNKRFGHSTSLLNNGDVLITGGSSNIDKADYKLQYLKTAELYNSKTKKFIKINDLKYHIYKHFSILLKDGNVLIVPMPRYFRTENSINRDRIPTKGIIYNAVSKDFSYSNDLYFSNVIFFQPVKNVNNNIILVVDSKKSIITKSEECKIDRNLVGCDNHSVMFDVTRNEFTKYDFKESILDNILIQINSNEIFLLNKLTGNARILNMNSFEEKKSKNVMKKMRILENQIISNNKFILIQGISKHKVFKSYIYNFESGKFFKINNPKYKQINASSIQLQDGRIMIVGGKNKYNKALDVVQIYSY